VIHEVAFHTAFVDDHDDPVKEVRRLGLVQHMKEKGVRDRMGQHERGIMRAAIYARKSPAKSRGP
jgi:hypothetical protein